MNERDQLLAQLLKISVAQLQLALQESTSAVNTLANSLTEIAASMDTTKAMSQASNLAQSLNHGISAMQFYDRLEQQIEHVVTHLSDATALLEQPSAAGKERMAAKRLQLEQLYSMESERLVCRRILSGESVEQALANSKTQLAQNSSDVELF
ncbi:MAG: hypothetical protein HWE13_15870 [Gammaproteobacteria bacterium]|nr:hypothetical protein [Gammaproteobacteria bacterium]NVK89616.1 hypothetical protein [Gammaproteobacteria bacterium]